MNSDELNLTFNHTQLSDFDPPTVQREDDNMMDFSIDGDEEAAMELATNNEVPRVQSSDLSASDNDASSASSQLTAITTYSPPPSSGSTTADEDESPAVSTEVIIPEGDDNVQVTDALELVTDVLQPMTDEPGAAPVNEEEREHLNEKAFSDLSIEDNNNSDLNVSTLPTSSALQEETTSSSSVAVEMKQPTQKASKIGLKKSSEKQAIAKSNNKKIVANSATINKKGKASESEDEGIQGPSTSSASASKERKKPRKRKAAEIAQDSDSDGDSEAVPNKKEADRHKAQMEMLVHQRYRKICDLRRAVHIVRETYKVPFNTLISKRLRGQIYRPLDPTKVASIKNDFDKCDFSAIESIPWVVITSSVIFPSRKNGKEKVQEWLEKTKEVGLAEGNHRAFSFYTSGPEVLACADQLTALVRILVVTPILWDKLKANAVPLSSSVTKEDCLLDKGDAAQDVVLAVDFFHRRQEHHNDLCKFPNVNNFRLVKLRTRSFFSTPGIHEQLGTVRKQADDQFSAMNKESVFETTLERLYGKLAFSNPAIDSLLDRMVEKNIVFGGNCHAWTDLSVMSWINPEKTIELVGSWIDQGLDNEAIRKKLPNERRSFKESLIEPEKLEGRKERARKMRERRSTIVQQRQPVKISQVQKISDVVPSKQNEESSTDQVQNDEEQNDELEIDESIEDEQQQELQNTIYRVSKELIFTHFKEVKDVFERARGILIEFDEGAENQLPLLQQTLALAAPLEPTHFGKLVPKDTNYFMVLSAREPTLLKEPPRNVNAIDLIL